VGCGCAPLSWKIAAEVVASERTVKFHRAHIMKKMKPIHSQTLCAWRLGLGKNGQGEPVHEDR